MTLMDDPAAVAPARPPPQRPPTPLPPPGGERRFTLTNIDWDTYVRLNDRCGPGTRVTYDRGRMELMSPSGLHELVKTVLARLIEAYALVAGIAIEGFGSVTMRREDLDRGLEPDECYYVANAAVMSGRIRPGDPPAPLDLSANPPPDLAIEVDISPPDIAKPPIYAAMGVPEIWRYDGRAVAYLIRQPDGSYVTTERSAAFPDLPLAWVNELLQVGLTRSQSAAVAELARRVTAGRRE